MEKDFYKLWREELLRDMRKKRSEGMRSLNGLENTGSVYYDSQVAYIKLVNAAIMAMEAAPETIGEFREIRDYGELLPKD